MAESPDAVRRALSRAAAVAVRDEQLFEVWVDVAVDEVMDDPVTEICGEYLPDDRMEGNEAGAGP